MQTSSTGQPTATPSLSSITQTSNSPLFGPAQENSTIEPRATEPPADYGSMQSNKDGENYVGSAHWAAVLDSIAELKDHVDNEELLQVEQEASDYPYLETGPKLLYGCPTPATKDEILASIPKRPVVDRLVSRYFNSFEMSPAVLHTVEFLKEYEIFWEDQTAVSVIWLGLLFTIMCLATQFEKSRLDPGIQTPAITYTGQDLSKTAEIFSLRISQCLVLGNYTRGGPYVLETLMLYIAAEILVHHDAEINVWILMGTTVQIAMQMGYHRDPRHFKNMSPFAAEMRKRVWATAVEMDLGISAQMGLPRIVKQWQTDTQEPSNFQDNDFDKCTVEMPRPRPDTELTPMLYRLVKAKMTSVLGLIWDFLADMRPYPWSEVEEMDKKLNEARNTIPECLRWHSIARCITDSPQHIMQKVVLETIFHRAKILLHRKYMFNPPAASDDSKRIVLESALKLLDYQHMIQEEIQPFCQLYQERWRVTSHARVESLPLTELLPNNETIRRSLRRSYLIWVQSSVRSKEARKVVKALEVVLGIAGGSTPETVDSGIGTGIPLDIPSASVSSSINEYCQEFSWGFGIQFPGFNSYLIPNWALLGDDPLTAPDIGPDSEWQTVNG
ncbi:transcriptional regulatory [Fusarium heterosporum]|uniref:Transcriptional regulatory n=1 Tax=Fusarium heterosporum TaxID=42747 RepID=A0A8H5TGB4_FUSHE|nr:transcriptional regulatory [Fusarium heterosporum]